MQTLEHEPVGAVKDAEQILKNNYLKLTCVRVQAYRNTKSHNTLSDKDA